MNLFLFSLHRNVFLFFFLLFILSCDVFFFLLRLLLLLLLLLLCFNNTTRHICSNFYVTWRMRFVIITVYVWMHLMEVLLFAFSNFIERPSFSSASLLSAWKIHILRRFCTQLFKRHTAIICNTVKTEKELIVVDFL